jgi:hypothetical protein
MDRRPVVCPVFCRPKRVIGRAITMEYVYFVGTVAAASLIVFLLVKVVVSLRYSGRTRRAGLDPIPPLKKTISGLSDKEKEELAFQSNLDSWQKKYHTQRGWFGSASGSQPLEGQKYTFTPPEPRQVGRKPRKSFELLPD